VSAVTVRIMDKAGDALAVMLAPSRPAAARMAADYMRELNQPGLVGVVLLTERTAEARVRWPA